MPRRGSAVHVTTTRRHYNGKTYETHLLRRSFRENGKVKNETVGNLSHLPPDLINLIRRRLAGERFLPASAVEIQRSLPHGHVLAVLHMLRKLGMAQLVDRTPSRERDLVLACCAPRLMNTRRHSR